MKGSKTAFAVLCFGAVFASHAHAQTVIGAEDSVNSFSISAGYGVYVTSYNADYYNLVGTYATGSGANYSFAAASYASLSETLNESFAGPGAGFAQSGYGIEQFFFLTNENVNGSGEYFSVYSILTQEQIVTAGGTAVDYGGIAEIGGSNFYGFNTVTLNGDGIATDNAQDWTVLAYNYSPGYSYTLSYGGFTDYIAFGQTIEIGVWSSGVTTATSSSSVPAPAAIAPFAIGLVGALRRRNKKS